MSNLPGMAYRCRNDRDWTMEFVSDGCLALTGYPPADVIENRKVSYAQLILDEDRESVWSDVQNALGENRPFQLTYRIVTADGSVKWTWEQGQGVYDTDDNLVALEGFITDITERRRLEEQLHQAQKMEAVGALAGGLAHDFNNILTAILGNAELLNAGLADPALNIRTLRERTREGLAQIEWAGQRAASLTRQLLAFSRRQVIRPQVLNLNDILRAMQDMLRRLSGEDVHLTMNLHANIDSIKADCGQVEQVVLNLMINARDAMSDGGTLEVETESVVLTERDVSEDAHPGPHVMLAVTDTGCGMSEDVVERIFEPFFTTKQLGKGTGLGLSTVFGIVRQAGGTIRVQSKPGEGTTFRVYWPRAEEAVRELVAAVAAVPRGSETILVAEDEDSIRHLTHRILEERGYTVLSAPNGTQAIEVAKEHAGTIHLLITDVIMPDINGVRLAQTLMAVRPDMKVLYLSGYTSDVIADRGVLKEGVEFIQKPFAGEMLARRAREVLDKERPTTS